MEFRMDIKKLIGRTIEDVRWINSPEFDDEKPAADWKFRVVAPESIPREYLTPDLVKIGQVVRAMRGATAIKGIETYAEKS